MSQVEKNVPLFVMSGILLIYGIIASTGALLPTMKYLHTHKALDLQVVMCFVLGILGIIGGIVRTIRPPKNTVLTGLFLSRWQVSSCFCCWPWPFAGTWSRW